MFLSLLVDAQPVVRLWNFISLVTFSATVVWVRVRFFVLILIHLFHLTSNNFRSLVDLVKVWCSRSPALPDRVFLVILSLLALLGFLKFPSLNDWRSESWVTIRGIAYPLLVEDVGGSLLSVSLRRLLIRWSLLQNAIIHVSCAIGWIETSQICSNLKHVFFSIGLCLEVLSSFLLLCELLLCQLFLLFCGHNWSEISVEIANEAIDVGHHGVALHAFVLLSLVKEATKVLHDILTGMQLTNINRIVHKTWEICCLVLIVNLFPNDAIVSRQYALICIMSLLFALPVLVLSCFRWPLTLEWLFFLRFFFIRRHRHRSLFTKVIIFSTFGFLLKVYWSLINVWQGIILLVFSFLLVIFFSRRARLDVWIFFSARLFWLPLRKELLLEEQDPRMLEHLDKMNSLVRVLLEELFD